METRRDRIELNERGKGRPRNYSDEQIKDLAEYIGAGLNDEEACVLAEIKYNSFKAHWKDSPHFCNPIQKAKAQKKYDRIKKVEDGHEGWQAVASLRVSSSGMETRRTSVDSNQHDQRQPIDGGEIQEYLLGFRSDR